MPARWLQTGQEMRTKSLFLSGAVIPFLLAFGHEVHAAPCGTFAWDNPSANYPAGVEHHVFHSASMNVDVGFNIYTPTNYATGTEPLPTIYFLHGVNGTEGTMPPNVVPWVASRVAKGLMRPAILVFANGAINSAYADAKDGSRRVETSILAELVPHVDQHWRTYACREQRAISGFSMGGGGALMYAFKHPDMFGSVVAYAGAVLDWQTLAAQHPDTATCMFGDDASHFDQYSPWYWLEKNASTIRSSLHVRMSVGDQDGLLADNNRMDAQLTALGISHAFEVVPGCKHEHGCLWTAGGDQGVAFHEASFSACGVSAAPVIDGGVAGDAGAPAAAATPTPDAAPEQTPPAVEGSNGCSAAPGRPLGAGAWIIALAALAVLRFRRARRDRVGRRALSLLTTLLAMVGCGGSSSSPDRPLEPAADTGPGALEDGAATTPDGGNDSGPPSKDGSVVPAATTVTCSALQIAGDPTSAQGASWTYHATDDGVEYELTGTLLQPQGAGPFPAVVVSHGLGGSASGYAKNIGVAMRPWGLVAIATNYTHGAMPAGLPTGPFGASPANLLRAHKARQLLGCLPVVDDKRVGAHGHSMGALLTGMLAGTYGGELKVASHSAGGVSDTGTVNDGIPTTTVAVASAIAVPYQLHHGDKDMVVPLAMDQRLDEILTVSGVPHELHVYAGYEHAQVALDATMLQRVHAWYMAHGLL